MLRHLFNALLSRCLNAPAPRPTRYYPPIRRPRPLKGHEQQAPPLRRFYPARQTLYLYRQPQLLLRQLRPRPNPLRKNGQKRGRENEVKLKSGKMTKCLRLLKRSTMMRPKWALRSVLTTIVDAYDVLEVEHLSHCSELGNKVNQILNRWAPSLAQMPLALDWRRSRRCALLGYDLRNDVDDDSSHL